MAHTSSRFKWETMLCVVAMVGIVGCRQATRDPHALVFLIQSSPANLDPRIGTDEPSEHIDELLFDGLVSRDANFNFKPALAESWQQPDPRTLIFHLRSGARFANGAPMTARDVAWSVDSMRKGVVISPRAASYASVASIETPDPLTVVFHLNQPDNFLLTNLSSGALGVVPYGSGKDFWRQPVGTGPFKFVSQRIDQDVLVERNPFSWSVVPKIERVRFAVVPDAITMSLELEKGSADVEINSLPIDALGVLEQRADIAVDDAPGTEIQYLAFNTRDAILKDARVRRAIAYAIDRGIIIRTLYRGHARPAASLLPVNHWAFAGDVARYDYDPDRANELLDEAGYKRGAGGVRFHMTMKTSTDERARLLAAVLQQQLARAGIALDLRSNEFATFYADVVHGAFQMYSLYWIGGNEQPDIFTYVFSSSRFPPNGANRGYYSNPQFDALLEEASRVGDQSQRRTDYIEAQKILARDLPSINLWYLDTIVVHNRRLTNVIPSPSGKYTFLATAALRASTPQLLHSALSSIGNGAFEPLASAGRMRVPLLCLRPSRRQIR
jgi:peptide/nickel transport system substrate-binding protein